MARKKMGKISTMGWVGIAAAGAAAVYLITRPRVPTTTYPPGYVPPGYLPPPTNNTGTIVNAGASVLNNLLHLFD